MPGDQTLVDRSDDRDAPERVRERQFDGVKLGVCRQFRRPAALRPDRVADQRRHAVGDHVDRGSGDDLVGALVDRGVAVDERNPDRRDEAREQSEPDAAGEGRHRRRAEGADQDLALKPDVDHARALRPETGEAGEDQRRAEPNAGGEDDDERVEEVHRAPPLRSAGRWCAARAARRPDGGTCARARPRTGRRGPG